MIIDFRIISKKYWTSDSYLSIDEQLIDFRRRFAHTMMLICKTAEVSFKPYNLCQKNYLIDFLFTFKIWSQNMKNRIWKADSLTQKIKISELKTTNQLNFSVIKWKFISFFLMTSAKPETSWGRREPAPAAQPLQPSQPQSQLSGTRKRLPAGISQMINFWYHFWLFWNKSKIW